MHKQQYTHIYSCSVHLSKAYRLRCSLFRSDLQKQKNFFVYILDMLFVFLFFWFIFKTERTAMKDYCLLVLSNETTPLYGTDGFKSSNQERHYQKERILMSLPS